MNKIRLYLILIMEISFITGCSIVKPNNDSNLDFPALKEFPAYGSTPVVQTTYFPPHVSCSKLEEAGEGLSWGKIQIGVTQYEDVLKILDPERVYWDLMRGHVVFKEKTQNDKFSYLSMNACFIDNKISFLSTYGKVNYPVTVDDLVKTFGIPDLVGWCCEDFAHRILVWAGEGIMVDIDLFEDERSTIALFPPMPAEDLEDSWITAELWYPDVESYIGDVPEWLLVKDPWGFTED